MTSTDVQTPSSTDPGPERSGEGPILFRDDPASIQTSARAFELASRANAAHRPEDLVESGTWEKYERRVAALARAHPRGDPFAGFLSRLAVDGWSSRNARQADRSALVRLAARDVVELTPVYWRELLSDVEDEADRERVLAILRPHLSPSVRAQIMAAPRRLTETERRRLATAVGFLVDVPPDPFHDQSRHRTSPETTAPDTRRRQARSAQTTLTALNRHARRKRADSVDYDWRDHFWTAAVLSDPHLDFTRRAILATMIITGARSAEFADDLGVDVSLAPAGDEDQLRVRIKGAKTTPQLLHEALPAKGQSTRILDIACKTPEAVWLRDALQDTEPLHLLAPTATQAATGVQLSPSERHRRVAVSLGKLVTRLGKMAFPGLRHNLTPYVFRHAIAADLKASERFDPEVIAAALGHQSTRTQASYGLKSGARGLCLGRADGIVSVSATAPVRNSGPEPHAGPASE